MRQSKLIQKIIRGFATPIRSYIQIFRQNNRNLPFFQIVEEAKIKSRIYRARSEYTNLRTCSSQENYSPQQVHVQALEYIINDSEE